MILHQLSFEVSQLWLGQKEFEGLDNQLADLQTVLRF